jgi:uncharacterized membrane protein
MEEGALKDVCPACGVPKTAFEPFTSKVSEKRENILNLHIHPIIIHIPQGFIISYPFILILGFIFPEPIKAQFFAASSLFGIFMPLFALLGIITGLIDGKIRFKKVTTPALLKKMILGIILFVLSLVPSVMILSGYVNYIIMLVFSILYLACGTILGKIGSSLTESKLPG